MPQSSSNRVKCIVVCWRSKQSLNHSTCNTLYLVILHRKIHVKRLTNRQTDRQTDRQIYSTVANLRLVNSLGFNIDRFGQLNDFIARFVTSFKSRPEHTYTSLTYDEQFLSPF